MVVNWTTPDPTKVLVVSAHRSGSSFIGELFNQNSEAFYLFEPLGAVQETQSTLGCNTNLIQKTCQLKQHYNCNMPNYHRDWFFGLIKQAPSYRKCPTSITVSQHHHGSCLRYNLCFRDSQKWSCNPKLCEAWTYSQNLDLVNEITNEWDFETNTEQCTSCKTLNRSFMNQMCQTKKIIAAKGREDILTS